ncbi:MAG: class I SAM-dependent methyltransferase [Elusimicrobiales bacterium]
MNKEARFGFGENWKAYASCIAEDRIHFAERSILAMLGEGALAGKTFADVGCGSGLFSLAALRLGAARVSSFDYDADSVAASLAVRDRFAPGDPRWTIQRGSVLDEDFVASLGVFDCVYSWGVLHHTGAMWRAVELAARMTRPGGLFFIALYNDQGALSRFWLAVKRTYNALPAPLRPLYVSVFFLRFWLVRSLKDLLRGRPFASLRSYRGRRGMSAWHDVVDWVGGLPFEVASPEAVEAFCRERGFSLTASRLEGGHGCNEFVFRAGPGPQHGL